MTFFGYNPQTGVVLIVALKHIIEGGERARTLFILPDKKLDSRGGRISAKEGIAPEARRNKRENRVLQCS